jgi:DNA-nicking Smr family endonuclease
MSFPEIDLHGLTLDEAMPEVERALNHHFLKEGEDRRLALITGRGEILQPAIERHLDQHPLVKEIRVDGGVLQVVLEDLS